MLPQSSNSSPGVSDVPLVHRITKTGPIKHQSKPHAREDHNHLIPAQITGQIKHRSRGLVLAYPYAA